MGIIIFLTIIAAIVGFVFTMFIFSNIVEARKKFTKNSWNHAAVARYVEKSKKLFIYGVAVCGAILAIRILPFDLIDASNLKYLIVVGYLVGFCPGLIIGIFILLHPQKILEMCGLYFSK